MNTAFLNALATEAASLITHIALVNSGGTQVGDGRKAVTWTSASDGLIRPTADLVFNMTADENVSGWKGWTAATNGTDYGGAALSTVTFGNDGTYTLLAASTGIDISAA